MSMRRGRGIDAVRQRQVAAEASADVGRVLQEGEAAHMAALLETFQTQLQAFAAVHRAQINSDPVFRRAFAEMTKSIGVDPLVSSKGYWSEKLGIGQFYYELSVQIVDVCMETRPINGGLISLTELCARVTQKRGAARSASTLGAGADVGAGGAAASSISREDVLSAIEKLETLSSGYRLVRMGSDTYVLSVTVEMNSDHTTLLQCVAGATGEAHGDAALAAGWTTVPRATASMGWDADRVQRALSDLTAEGMAWVDTQAPECAVEGARYYFPAVYFAAGGDSA